MQPENPIIVITGPTASGKSSLAIELAKSIDAEIVNSDSMQVYRKMNIGTAKIPEDKRVVPHHCIDILDPGEPYSAALFQKDARKAFREISEARKRCILCGGTGFYIRAAIDDYDFAEGEQVGNEVRDRYNEVASRAGREAVWKILNERDPSSAAIIPPNDLKRVIRALEMLEAGDSYSNRRSMLQSIKQKEPAIFIGIDVERETLRKRIDERVDSMREEGLVNEVEGLLDMGFRDAVTSNQAIGYKEIVEALDGKCTFEDAFESIKISTKRYAKRQRTWFRGDKRINWIQGTSGNINEMLEQSINLIKESETI